MTDRKESGHKLFNMLMSAPEITESEIEDLFSDLKYVLENPFDPLIQEAVTCRNCTYVEVADQRAC